MIRRLVLAATAAALVFGGAGAAGATAGKASGPTSVDPRQHQLCVILYDTRGGTPTPVCINW